MYLQLMHNKKKRKKKHKQNIKTNNQQPNNKCVRLTSRACNQKTHKISNEFDTLARDNEWISKLYGVSWVLGQYLGLKRTHIISTLRNQKKTKIKPKLTEELGKRKAGTTHTKRIKKVQSLFYTNFFFFCFVSLCDLNFSKATHNFHCSVQWSKLTNEIK